MEIRISCRNLIQSVMLSESRNRNIAMEAIYVQSNLINIASNNIVNICNELLDILGLIKILILFAGENFWLLYRHVRTFGVKPNLVYFSLQLRRGRCLEPLPVWVLSWSQTIKSCVPRDVACRALVQWKHRRCLRTKVE